MCVTVGVTLRKKRVLIAAGANFGATNATCTDGVLTVLCFFFFNLSSL